MKKVMASFARCALAAVSLTALFAGCATAPQPTKKPNSLMISTAYDESAPFPGLAGTIQVYEDPDKRLSSFKTYAFDYTSTDNPLLEKQLFKLLQPLLDGKGLTRDDANPDLLVTMSFYAGRKESYVPPQTITTTRVEQVWSTGVVGLTLTGHYDAVPVTESKTSPGRTEVSYYHSIRVNILDFAKLKGGGKPKIPPLVWMGEAGDQGTSPDIRAEAPALLGMLMHGRRVQLKYGGLDLDCNLDGDALVIAAIRSEPGGAAEAAGLHAGDTIRAIDGAPPSVLVTRGSTKSVGSRNHVISGGNLTTYFGVESEKVEFEVECPHQKTIRSVWLP